MKFRMKKLMETMLRDTMLFVKDLSHSGAEGVEEKQGLQQSELDAWKKSTTTLLKANTKWRPKSSLPHDKPLHKELAAQLQEKRLVLELAMAAQMKGRARAEKEACAFASENVVSKEQMRLISTEVATLKIETAKLNKDNELLQSQVDDAKEENYELLLKRKSDKGKMEKADKLQLKAPTILAPHEAGSAFFRPRPSVGYPALPHVSVPGESPPMHAVP
jgi:hypothetical protein